MPRSIWRGVMSFGMVAIPVRLYLATESSSKVSFNLLCPEHRSRIKNKRYCVEGDHEVAWGDVVRGYEYEKGNYVELTDEDLEKLPLRSSKAIDITGFIKDDQLPGSLYYQSAYYLEPEKSAQKPYALMKKTLEKTGQIAIAKFEGREDLVEASEPEAETTVVDLMSALKASVAKAKEEEKKGGRAGRGGHESIGRGKDRKTTKVARKKA